MKRMIWFLSLFITSVAWGQNLPVTGTIAANLACVQTRAQNNSAVGIVVTGTWSGTLTPSVFIVSSRTVNKKVAPVDGSAQATITANGGFTATVGGFAVFQICATAWTSGTATIDMFSTPAPNTTVAAAGGGGTVTSVSGTSPIASTGGNTPTLSLTNSGAANVTAALGTDTKYFTASGSAAVSGDVISGDAQGGTQDSGTLLSSLAPLASPTFTGTPVSTTQAANDSSTKIATDAFVMGQVPALTQPFMPFGLFASLNQAPFPTGANTAGVWGFNLPYALTTAKFFYRVGTIADNTANVYGVAIVNSSGTMVLHFSAAGTTFAPAASATKNASWVEGSTTLQPGKYYVEATSSCAAACATFSGGGGGTVTFYANTALGITAGGTPQSIAAPGTGSESLTSTPFSLMLE